MKKQLWWVIMPLMVIALSACDKEGPINDDNGNNLGNGNSSGQDFNIFSPVSYDDMVYVEGGTFLMGAQSISKHAKNYNYEARSNERPVHNVTVSSYYISKYEVTQEMWEYVMLYSGKAADGSTMSPIDNGPWLGPNDLRPNDNRGRGAYYPAYFVSYEDIVNHFIPRINKITGITFSLPTEAEWEFAALGGNKSNGYRYSGSTTSYYVAWYWEITQNLHHVAELYPNELGLYDMSGNVWEWCSDWYGNYDDSSQTNPTGPSSGSNRVVKGGSWYDSVTTCRVTCRSSATPSYRAFNVGFRLVCRK